MSQALDLTTRRKFRIIQRADDNAEWAMGRFKSPGSTQRFLSVHDAIYNLVNLRRFLFSRRTLYHTRVRAFTEWFEFVAA
jgi:hypothetical protein